MDESKGKNVPLIWLILCLCLLNLAGISYLVWRTHSADPGPLDAGKAPLPAGLDSTEERMALFNRFKPLYNAKDYDGLYLLFDEAMRVQVSKDKVVETLDDLYSFTGQMKNGAFVSYDARAGQGGARHYVLSYLVDTDKGRAVLRLNAFQQGQEAYRLMGFKIDKQ